MKLGNPSAKAQKLTRHNSIRHDPLKFYFPSLLITSTIATMVHIKHETFQLKMVHLAQFIQLRNPMRNMKKCLNSSKTSEY